MTLCPTNPQTRSKLDSRYHRSHVRMHTHMQACTRITHSHTQHTAGILSAIDSNNSAECVQAHNNLDDHSGLGKGDNRRARTWSIINLLSSM